MTSLPQRLSILVFLASTLELGGCSFIFSNGPPPDHSQLNYFDCSGYTAPVLDTIWASLNGIGAIAAGSTSQASWDASSHPASRQATIGVGLLWLGVSGASAIYGYSKASECSEAKDQLNQRVNQAPRRRRLPPPVYAPPSSGPPPSAFPPPPATSPAPVAPPASDVMPGPPASTPQSPPASTPQSPPASTPQSPPAPAAPSP